MRTIFIEGLRDQIENQTRSEFSFSQFIQTHLAGQMDRITRGTVRSFGLEANKRHQIHPAIKSAGRGFIPGSSLKGAIRTAILHDWLNQTEAGAKVLGEAYVRVLQAHRGLAEIKQLEYKKKKEKRLPGDEFRRLNNLKKSLNRTQKYLDREILKEEDLFGRTNDRRKGPDSQQIRVGDSTFFPLEAMAVYQAERIRLVPVDPRGKTRQDQSTIPQPRECIDRG